MHGPYIEQQFSHIEFENEQLKRKLETRRLLEEAPRQDQKPPRRSLVSLFGRFLPQLVSHAPARRSSLTSR